MNDEITKLKNQIKLLKEKYNKKSQKLIKANKSLIDLSQRSEKQKLFEHRQDLMCQLFHKLTTSLDTYVYRVQYKYYDDIYLLEQVQSYGSKWLSYAVVLHLADKQKLIVRNYEIEIIKAQKLW